jgi:site-specific recombinase XerD
LPSRNDGTVLAWAARYEELALTGVRSREVTERIGLHLQRFAEYLSGTYGHERLEAVVRRDVAGLRDALVSSGLGPSTVNNHLASLAGFWGWVAAQAPEALPGGNPTSGVRTLALAPLEPRALTPAQVRSPKRVVDRLERFHAPKGRRNDRGEAQHGHARAMRDRAIVYVLLSTGLRRAELVTLDVTQISPCEPGLLREAKRARLTAVVGKGGTTRMVFLSADARAALADYLEGSRPSTAIIPSSRRCSWRGRSTAAPRCSTPVTLSASCSRCIGRYTRRTATTYQEAAENRRQLAAEIGEVIGRFVDELVDAGWSEAEARNANVHELAARVSKGRGTPCATIAAQNC